MTSTGPAAPGEDPVERSLEQGLRRSPLRDDAYARIHAAVAAEWRASVRPRSRWTPRRWATLAAGLAATALIASILLQVFVKTPPFGVVARVDRGTMVSRSKLLPDRLVEARSVLHAGDVLVARGPVLVELQGGGTLRVARGSRLEITGTDAVFLDRGEVYMDFPPGLNRAPAFAVRTPLGVIEHLGTQFDVAVGSDLRVRVREGSVRLRRGSQTETAGAGTELVVPRVGQASEHAIPSHGPEWAWVEALEPDYPIENRKLSDFLQWAARESGGHLHYVDEHAREVAERTRLHGSIQGLSVTDALETVLATTSLRYNFEQDRIEVSSGG